MPFSITGTGPDGRQTATRLAAASAIVLADRWEEAGVQNVLVQQNENAPMPVEKMRIRIYGRPRPH